MCNNNVCGSSTNGGCVCEVVRFICNLQSQVRDEPNCCNSRPLSTSPQVRRADTRPFILYLNNGDLFRPFINTFPFRSPILRVEKMEGCCACCRVLRMVSSVPRDEEISVGDLMCGKVRLECTNTFVTIDLDRCAGIQCLKDVRLNC